MELATDDMDKLLDDDDDSESEFDVTVRETERLGQRDLSSDHEGNRRVEEESPGGRRRPLGHQLPYQRAGGGDEAVDEDHDPEDDETELGQPARQAQLLVRLHLHSVGLLFLLSDDIPGATCFPAFVFILLPRKRLYSVWRQPSGVF